MRKLIFFVIILAVILYVYMNRAWWFLKHVTMPMNFERLQYKDQPAPSLVETMDLLKARRDNAAWLIFTKIVLNNPNDQDALWGKAEVLRRKRNYQESEGILNQILAQNPKHTSAMLSLAYIRYKDDRLDEAQTLVSNAFSFYPNKETEALAYMLLGIINSRRAAKGGAWAKFNYGTQVKCYLVKAKELAPQLPEIRLALGTFYLLAPCIVGGNLEKARQELEVAVGLAPDFATANARLAQYYRKKGSFDKYSVYREKAEEIDPDNEVLQELSSGR